MNLSRQHFLQLTAGAVASVGLTGLAKSETPQTPHTPSPLHAQRHSGPAPAKAIS